MKHVVGVTSDGRTVYWTGQSWIDNLEGATRFDEHGARAAIDKLRRVGIKAVAWPVME